MRRLSHHPFQPQLHKSLAHARKTKSGQAIVKVQPLKQTGWLDCIARRWKLRPCINEYDQLTPAPTYSNLSATRLDSDFLDSNPLHFAQAAACHFVCKKAGQVAQEIIPRNESGPPCLCCKGDLAVLQPILRMLNFGLRNEQHLQSNSWHTCSMLLDHHQSCEVGSNQSLLFFLQLGNDKPASFRRNVKRRTVLCCSQ